MVPTLAHAHPPSCSWFGRGAGFPRVSYPPLPLVALSVLGLCDYRSCSFFVHPAFGAFSRLPYLYCRSKWRPQLNTCNRSPAHQSRTICWSSVAGCFPTQGLRLVGTLFSFTYTCGPLRTLVVTPGSLHFLLSLRTAWTVGIPAGAPFGNSPHCLFVLNSLMWLSVCWYALDSVPFKLLPLPWLQFFVLIYGLVTLLHLALMSGRRIRYQICLFLPDCVCLVGSSSFSVLFAPVTYVQSLCVLFSCYPFWCPGECLLESFPIPLHSDNF